MDLETAVETLQDLIGRLVAVRVSDSVFATGEPFRVEQIDYLANRERRCVMVRVDSLGIEHHLRLPVADITCDPMYFDADAAVARAPLANVRRVVERYAFDRVCA